MSINSSLLQFQGREIIPFRPVALKLPDAHGWHLLIYIPLSSDRFMFHSRENYASYVLFGYIVRAARKKEKKTAAAKL